MLKITLFGLLAVCLTLASCSTSTLYYKPLKQRPTTPWEGSSSRYGGYIEKSQGNGKYEITFEAYNRPDREAVAHFLMLRAAERTLIDGKTHFYASSPKISSRDEESYFPAYTIAGHWDTVSVRHCVYNRKTKQEDCHYDDEQVWCPPEYVPPRYITNYIHKGKLRISYSSGSKRHRAIDIVTSALTHTKLYGKPKLDPRAMAHVPKSLQ